MVTIFQRKKMSLVIFKKKKVTLPRIKYNLEKKKDEIF